MKAEGRTELGFGIGINHGEAVIGNIGSYERMNVSTRPLLVTPLILPRAWNLLRAPTAWTF